MMITEAPKPKRVWRLDDCPRPGETAPADAVSAPLSVSMPDSMVIPPPQPAYVALDDGWREWIADNAIRRCPVDGMVATMAEAGLDPLEAKLAIDSLTQSPGYRAALKMRGQRDKLANIMDNLQRQREGAALSNLVEKRSRVSREEFLARYVHGCRPVVLTDIAADWPARERWTFDHFKRRFGALTVEVQGDRQADSEFELNKLRHKRSTRLDAFIDRIAAAGLSNDEYLTANNELLRRPEFASLFDDIGSLPDYCDRERLANSASLWIGPAGTRTPLHHDTFMLFHTQIVGRKRWRMVSPMYTARLYNDVEVFSPIDLDHLDPVAHPEAVGVPVLDVVVEAGETLFLPLGWWHQVGSLDMCISLSYTNVAAPNEYRFVSPQGSR